MKIHPHGNPLGHSLITICRFGRFIWFSCLSGPEEHRRICRQETGFLPPFLDTFVRVAVSSNIGFDQKSTWQLPSCGRVDSLRRYRLRSYSFAVPSKAFPPVGITLTSIGVALDFRFNLCLVIGTIITLWESVLKAPSAKTFACERIVGCNDVHAAALLCMGESNDGVTRQVTLPTATAIVLRLIFLTIPTWIPPRLLEENFTESPILKLRAPRDSNSPRR